MPQASTIIPVYNREDFIGRAIESVLEQTHDDFEIIVVDDGSTDSSREVVEAFDDDRVKSIAFDENQGANAARNAGIEAAEGEIVTFLDSDDEYDPSFLETVIEYLSRASQSVGGVYTSRRKVRDRKVVDLDLANQSFIHPKSVLHDYQAFGFSNWAFRGEVFDEVGLLDESLCGLQDREFMIRYLAKYEFHGIDEVLVTQHQHAGQMSANPDLKLSALNYMTSKHNDLIDETAQAYIDYHKGWLHAKGGDINTARQHFWQAFRRRPMTGKFQIQAMASLCGRSGFWTINNLKQRMKYALSQLRP